MDGAGRVQLAAGAGENYSGREADDMISVSGGVQWQTAVEARCRFPDPHEAAMQDCRVEGCRGSSDPEHAGRLVEGRCGGRGPRSS